MELVHLDVCKPFYSPPLMRHGYYVTFMYDYSKKTWIFFTRKKNEVFSKFMEYKPLVETKPGKISKH